MLKWKEKKKTERKLSDAPDRIHNRKKWILRHLTNGGSKMADRPRDQAFAIDIVHCFAEAIAGSLSRQSAAAAADNVLSSLSGCRYYEIHRGDGRPDVSLHLTETQETYLFQRNVNVTRRRYWENQRVEKRNKKKKRRRN